MPYYVTNSELYGQLPIFPTLYDYPNPITAERIERQVERLTDIADRRYLAGKATTEQYDRWTKALSGWADKYYAQVRV